MISRRRLVVTSAASLAAPAFLRTFSASAQDKVNLKVAGESDYTAAAIEFFQQANPNISVELFGGTLVFEDGSLQSTLQSGEGPDVLRVNSGPGRVGALAANGLLQPLDGVYEANGLEPNYQPNVIEQIRAQNADGKIYEIVEGLDVFTVYYRTNVFEEHGLAAPATWDEFLTVCQTLKDAGQPPITLGARDNFQGGWLGGNILQASVGREAMTDAIYGTGTFNGPNFIRAGEMLKQLVDEGYINGMEAAALSGEQATAAFGQGQGVMVVQPQGMLPGLEHDGIDISQISNFLMPSPNEGQAAAATAGLAVSWVLPVSTKQQEAAEAWLAFVASDDYLRIVFENGGELVPSRIVPDSFTLPPSVANGAENLAGAGYNPSVYLPSAAKDAWYTAIQNLLTGQASPEDAMNQIDQALQESRA